MADKFWLGETDTHSITKASVHKMLTAIHGRLLSRESLIHFHDQSREGVSRVHIGNRSSLKTVTVKAFSINQATNTPVNRERKDIRVPKNHDLVVAVSDWDRLDLNTEAVSF
mgnify:FL=1